MKKILVMGATSTIALACAQLWALDGSEFFLVARNVQKLHQVADDLRVRGAGRVIDAADIGAHAAMLGHCLEGLGHIDIVLIAHGTLPDQQACEQDVALSLREFANNGTSVIALLTLLSNQLEAQRHGVLAVISSVAGERGRPSNYLYGAAKAAISTFCEGLRARLFNAGVYVTTIKPGFVDTPMTQGLKFPAMLVAEPDRVARRIVMGIERRAAVLYVPGFWALIMLAIRSIPQPLFKRLKL
ncbi:SDR family oxidoreductase [Pseudomonas sp. FEN]|uniref:SDR family oxidoreductase n=1 Tax=Pseudomonas sp. FEN TaxID=2767468 RepID=UPI0017498250|nr:SDR family oxidoreductase [Pseudomonas sp. FEN]